MPVSAAKATRPAALKRMSVFIASSLEWGSARGLISAFCTGAIVTGCGNGAFLPGVRGSERAGVCPRMPPPIDGLRKRLASAQICESSAIALEVPLSRGVADARLEAAMFTHARFIAPFSLALAFFSVPATADAELVRIYVTNSAGDSVHVVDPATNKVVQEFKGPEAMHGIAFAPDGSRVYVSNEHERTLDVFNRDDGKLIKQVKLSERPNNIAVANDGRIAVGIARGHGALDIVDPNTLELRATIPVNGRLHNVYVTRDSKYVITGSIPNKIITVIDLDKEQVAWEIKLDKGIRPMAIDSNADGSPKRIFAQLSELNGFAVLDFAARKEVARITLPKAPEGFETDPGRDTSPSHGIGVSPDGITLWVTSIP